MHILYILIDGFSGVLTFEWHIISFHLIFLSLFNVVCLLFSINVESVVFLTNNSLQLEQLITYIQVIYALFSVYET